jgi:hypothetical protein
MGLPRPTNPASAGEGGWEYWSMGRQIRGVQSFSVKSYLTKIEFAVPGV